MSGFNFEIGRQMDEMILAAIKKEALKKAQEKVDSPAAAPIANSSETEEKGNNSDR